MVDMLNAAIRYIGYVYKPVLFSLCSSKHKFQKHQFFVDSEVEE